MRTLARAGRVTYVGRNTFISMHAAYHESIAAPAPASVAEDMPESKEEQHAVVTLRTEFLDVQAKHAVAPITFRETNRDFKRYAAVIAATSSKTLRAAMAKPSRMRKTSALLCVGSCAGHPATSQPLRKPNTLNFNLKNIRARPKWRAFFLSRGNSDIQKVSSTL